MKISLKWINLSITCLTLAACSHYKDQPKNSDVSRAIAQVTNGNETGNKEVDIYELFKSGKYSCSLEEGERHIGPCQYPTLSEVKAFRDDFLKDKDARSKKLNGDIKEIMASADAIERQAKDFYSKNGENTFSQAYMQLSKDIRVSYEVVRLKEILDLVGESSIYVASLDKLSKFLKTWDARVDLPEEEKEILKRQKYLELITDENFMVSIARSKYYVEDIFKEKSLLSYLDFDFDKYIDVEDCDTIKKSIYAVTKVFPARPFNPEEGMNPVKDWQFYAKALHGPNGRPLTVTCQKAKAFSSESSKYESKNHRLIISYKKFTDVTLPGNGGDLNFHFDKEFKTPSAQEYRKVLKSSMK
jgi:hypothetical protein